MISDTAQDSGLVRADPVPYDLKSVTGGWMQVPDLRPILGHEVHAVFSFRTQGCGHGLTVLKESTAGSLRDLQSRLCQKRLARLSLLLSKV
jgi:hypothetical protein